MFIQGCVVVVSLVMGISAMIPDLTDLNMDIKSQVAEYRTFCYSCSSESVMCQKQVYDGQYLTTVPCKSMCFLRQENNVTYRGCFDGWLGGLVRNDYLGCKKQIYYGQKVEWCFCTDSHIRQGEPCNGAPRSVMADNARDMYDPMYTNYHSNVVDYNDINSKSTVYNKKSVERRGPEPKMADFHNEVEEYPLTSDADGYREGPESLQMCQDRSDGSYRDPNDCNRYYLCSNGYAYRMRCPKGTQWNQALGSCAFSFHLQNPCKVEDGTELLPAYPATYGNPQQMNTDNGYELHPPVDTYAPKLQAKELSMPSYSSSYDNQLPHAAYGENLFGKPRDIVPYGGNYAPQQRMVAHSNNMYDAQPVTSYNGQFDAAPSKEAYGKQENQPPMTSYDKNVDSKPQMASYDSKYDNKLPMTSYEGNFEKQPLMTPYDGKYQKQPPLTSYNGKYEKQSHMTPYNGMYEKQLSMTSYNEDENKQHQAKSKHTGKYVKQQPRMAQYTGKYVKRPDMRPFEMKDAPNGLKQNNGLSKKLAMKKSYSGKVMNKHPLLVKQKSVKQPRVVDNMDNYYQYNY